MADLSVYLLSPRRWVLLLPIKSRCHLCVFSHVQPFQFPKKKIKKIKPTSAYTVFSVPLSVPGVVYHGRRNPGVSAENGGGFFARLREFFGECSTVHSLPALYLFIYF